MSSYLYHCFGLICQLPLAHPAMQVAKDVEPDVIVSYGETPEFLADTINLGLVFENNTRQALLRPCPGLSLLVEDGKRIIIDRSPEVDDLTVQLFLTNLGFAALLQQRSTLVLHGAALYTPDGGAVALIGHSGDGKSTAAAALAQKGLHIWCDEMITLGVQDQQVFIEAGAHEVQLWDDAIKVLWPNEQSSAPELLPVRESIAKQKWLCPPGKGLRRIPLKAIYVMNTHNHREPSLEKVSGVHRLSDLISRNYRAEQFNKHALKGAQLKTAEKVASMVEIKRFYYSSGWKPFKRTIDTLFNEIQQDLS